MGEVPYPKRVKIVEVGPRDGLQNEATIIATEKKIQFIKRLREAGCPSIEASSFIRPDKLAQMGDAEEVMRAFGQTQGLSCLVPNIKGLERALQSGVQEIAVFTATSEIFNNKNINASTEWSLTTIQRVTDEAKKNGLRVRGYISTVFGCPYEGETSTEVLKNILDRFENWGIDEYSLGDTISLATPLSTESLIVELQKNFDLSKIAMHFHDTRGLALANILVSLQKGIAIFDASAGGLGGCPYAPKAGGNVATEDVVYLLDSIGIETGIDLKKIIVASQDIFNILDRESFSTIHRLFKNE